MEILCSFLPNRYIKATVTKKKLQFVGNKAKGRISNQVFQENKARQIFRKTNISYHLIRTRCFLETPGLRFALLPYYRQIKR